MPNSSSESRCSSARPRSHAAHESSSSSCCSLLELVALGLDDGLGRLGDEALVGELALGALDLLAQRARRARRRARCSASRSTASDGSTSTDAAGHADGRDRLVAVGGELEAREPRDVLGHALVAGRVQPRRHARARRRAARRRATSRSACVASIARATSASASRSRSAASASGQRWPISRSLRSRAGSDQISSVTNGITGCASASVSASTCSANSAVSRVVLGVQARLEHLEVPVAQLAVDEAVERAASRGGTRSASIASRDLGLGRLQARQDPRVLDRRRRRAPSPAPSRPRARAAARAATR